MVFPIQLIFLLIFFAGVVVLQVWLSKKESKWLGLILPAICFVLSVVVVVSMVSYSMVSTSSVVQEIGGSGALTSSFQSAVDMKAVPVLAVGTIIAVFLLYNIPTLVLLGIYLGCRAGRKKRDRLNKMRVQDLE